MLRRKRKAQSEGNKNLLATICIDLGDYYLKTGHYASAIEEFITVADVYKETGRMVEYGSANRMIGEAYMQIREFDKALEYQQIHLGKIHAVSEFVSCILILLDVAAEAGNQLEEQRALANMGHIYLTKYLDIPDNPDNGSLRSAYSAFMKSLEVCEKYVCLLDSFSEAKNVTK